MASSSYPRSSPKRDTPCTCKGLELPAYLPDSNPGYPWAIAGGHMSMATHLLLPLENDISFEYWVKAITERGLFQVQSDMKGLCKFAGVTPPSIVQAFQHETGFEIAPQEFLATVRRAYIRGLWLERKQGFERSDYTLPSEVFDCPNDQLGLGPFVTREFFSALSERVWTRFRQGDCCNRIARIRLPGVLGCCVFSAHA